MRALTAIAESARFAAVLGRRPQAAVLQLPFRKAASLLLLAVAASGRRSRRLRQLDSQRGEAALDRTRISRQGRENSTG